MANTFDVIMTDEDVIVKLAKEAKEKLSAVNDMDFKDAAQKYVKKGLYKPKKSWEETWNDYIQFLAVKEALKR